MDLDFTYTNPVGEMISIGGQRYRAVTVEPHRRQDGSDMLLIMWHSHCADCGREFTAKTPLKITSTR